MLSHPRPLALRSYMGGVVPELHDRRARRLPVCLSLWSETRRGTTHAVELGGDLLAVESGNAGSDGVVGASEHEGERGHGEAITGL